MLTSLKMRREGIGPIRRQIRRQVEKQLTGQEIWESMRIRVRVQHQIELQTFEEIATPIDTQIWESF